MTALLDIIMVVIVGYIAWTFRSWVYAQIKYKEARYKEVQRRLQVEARNEAALDIKLRNTPDEIDRIEIQLEASRERGRRALAYVLQDIMEKEKESDISISHR